MLALAPSASTPERKHKKRQEALVHLHGKMLRHGVKIPIFIRPLSA